MDTINDPRAAMWAKHDKWLSGEVTVSLFLHNSIRLDKMVTVLKIEGTF